ncbi:hypothetical protein [Pseudonocardia sp. H11422]|uniref:hypothetical protein n=1 Tax=Pseudonocardia sp. H11422 TaxID=2835866 RepID=UPI00202872CD|nr:hypothetical protein [Pseudonocardia sp. H11422]
MDRVGRAPGATVVDTSAAVALPAQATCAHVLPARAISSPGWIRDEQTPQVVAYFAVIGTWTP